MEAPISQDLFGQVINIIKALFFHDFHVIRWKQTELPMALSYPPTLVNLDMDKLGQKTTDTNMKHESKLSYNYS